MAAAKGLRIPFKATINNFKEPDLDHEIEVRSTFTETGHLIVKIQDQKNRRFVLVTGKKRSYSIAGWIDGHDAITKKFFRSSPYMAYFIPQEELRPVEELMELIAGEKERAKKSIG